MKKLFLIPLMAMLCTVMAFATVRTAGTFGELQDALSASANGDEIQLTADIAYPANGTLLNVTKNVTIDGQGHTLSGYAKRTSSAYPTIGINVNNTDNETELTLKNITIENDRHDGAYQCRPIEARGHVKSITLENVTINAPYGDTSNAQIITIGGDDQGWCSETKMTEINMSNTKIVAGKSSYCITSFNPYKLNAENCEFHGWCVADLAMPSGSFGSRYSVLTLDACLINTYNKHNTETNAYAAFSLRDGGITINLNNCTMNATELGSQAQWILLLNNFAPKARRNYPVVLNITGDNSNLNDALLSNGWTSGRYANTYYGESVMPETFSLTVNISGGTYPFNPEKIYWFKNGLLEGEEKYAISNLDSVRIPSDYEVKEITTQQGDQVTTLYRVRKKITTSYVINDDAEGEGKGKNENTEFIITGGGNNQSVGTATTDSVIANYIEVSDNATLTIPEDKVLVVTNGLDVTDGATLDVKAGSTLIVGEGGVTAETVESIVVEADENGSASFLLDPEVVVNTTPNITIKMTAKQIGYDSEDDAYYWFRFAAPVAGIEAVERVPERPTYFYMWNYAANEWSSISALSDLEPFQGFSLTTPHVGQEDVTYTFKGRLAGNQDMALQFKSRGYNYFGNSYTGYIDVLALVQQLMENDAIDGTVYMWDNEWQRFKDIPLGDLAAEPVDSWKRQIAPMQTFILRQVHTGEPTSTEINYASAIWGNPRYGLVSTPTPTPAPKRVNSDVTKLTIVVTSANGKMDDITFKESDEFSDEYNKGFDAVKFMNERQINLYSTINNENLGSVATDNIEGKLISMQTVKDHNYTMSFENVSSKEYAIRDNVTGAVIAIEEGAIYEFAAQPNSLVENRFEIVSIAKVPTAIENAAVKANAKGIYTIMGQYLGEDFQALPAGVYVVDGVKIVK